MSHQDQVLENQETTQAEEPGVGAVEESDAEEIDVSGTEEKILDWLTSNLGEYSFCYL